MSTTDFSDCCLTTKAIGPILSPMNRTDNQAILVRRLGNSLISECAAGEGTCDWDDTISEQWNFAAAAERLANNLKITGTWFSAKLHDGSYVFTRTCGHGVFEF